MCYYSKKERCRMKSKVLFLMMIIMSWLQGYDQFDTSVLTRFADNNQSVLMAQYMEQIQKLKGTSYDESFEDNFVDKNQLVLRCGPSGLCVSGYLTNAFAIIYTFESHNRQRAFTFAERKILEITAEGKLFPNISRCYSAMISMYLQHQVGH